MLYQEKQSLHKNIFDEENMSFFLRASASLWDFLSVHIPEPAH